ncbi:MAG: hypothetical protein JWO69_2008 [Thermoleophilia bacterium]|nr:hypothetical protein [Thermoleophilia bacterium]
MRRTCADDECGWEFYDEAPDASDFCPACNAQTTQEAREKDHAFALELVQALEQGQKMTDEERRELDEPGGWRKHLARQTPST